MIWFYELVAESRSWCREIRVGEDGFILERCNLYATKVHDLA
jgi:hypothetical protein